ncbi:sulfatase-like hydrolase/transferase [Novipirellula artificiosorum]|uniref:Sulfatase n=1 Tax=Novipirellula artificiosorum TaxID=2528016 RepID=A0A5C6DWS0_9BACT|nr:sulfatase-like hydrolase/transferase [Novipirellula artificiosorum]TWU40654.1 Sulfatase [Novipirellula artificiosorum]
MRTVADSRSFATKASPSGWAEFRKRVLKWHLNGVRGEGVPVLGDDANHPGHYGFDEWLSVTNYFDVNPLMSRNGKFEEFTGDSSAVVVTEALKFMARQKAGGAPFLAVIWYGSPHAPMRAMDEDLKGLPRGKAAHHLGEIVGIDRSIGALRKGLRELGIDRDTLVWYCSDNGGLNVDPNAVGHLRGHKGDLFEGGIRRLREEDFARSEGEAKKVVDRP